MKKVFSLVLVMVMVLTLAPLSAFAAENELDVTLPWEEMADCKEENQYYTYAADADGTVTLDVVGVFGQVGCTIARVSGSASFVPVEKLLTAAEKITFDVVAGNIYEICFAGVSGDNQKVIFKSSFSTGSGEEGGATGGTSLENAIDLTANKTISIVANGKTYYKVAMLDNTKTYNVTVTNSAFGPMAGQQQIGVVGYFMGQPDGETEYSVGETTAVVRPAMDGTIYFSVENVFMYADLNATVTITEADAEGGDGEGDDEGDGEDSTVGTYEDPAELTGGIQSAYVKDYEMYYLEFTAEEAGRLWVEVAPNETEWLYDIYINGEYIDYISASSATGKEDIVLAAGDTVLLGFGSGLGTDEIKFDASFEEGTFTKIPNGKETAPYNMLLGENVAVLKADGFAWYKYVAKESGTLTITMKTDDSPKGWFYDGYVNDYDSTYFPPNPETYFGNASTDTDPASLRSIPVREGDVVMFMVMTAFDEDYNRPAGSVVFSAWFVAGEGNTDEKDEYSVSDEVLVLGENTVELDPYANTTIFEFVPEEEGTYIFKTDNGVLGYWGGGSFFVSDQTENKTATLKYNLENVGPSIMIGVTGEGEATIKVERAGAAETKPTIPTIVYSNTAAPEELEVFETVNINNSVNVTDDTIDVAVLGNDGYYHLNSANGPVLFAQLNSDKVSLLSAYSYGRVNGVVTNANGETIAIVDYNEAFMEYYQSAHHVDISDDVSYAYYPVTKDLAAIIQAVSDKEDWLSYFCGDEETGELGAKDADEVWMIICSYDANLTSISEKLDKVEVEDTNIVIKDTGKITTESLEAVLETTTSENIIFTTGTGDKTVSFEFVVDEFELIDGKETYDFSVELVDDYAGATEDETVIAEDRFVLRVNFSYEGKLPANAVISIPVGEDYAGKTLYYYEVLADGTLKYVCDAPVDADGIAKVSQDHCSDYVLLTAAKAGNAITGDSANFALWIAVLGLGVVALAGSVVMKKREF